VPSTDQAPYTNGSKYLEAPATSSDIRDIGDTLNVNDPDTANVDYTLTAAALARANAQEVNYSAIETFGLTTAFGDNVLEVFLSIPGAAPALPHLVTFDGGDGTADRLVVQGSVQRDINGNIIGDNFDDVFKVSSIIDYGTTPGNNTGGQFQVSDKVERLHLIGKGGNDTIINDTSIRSMIEGNEGDDILVGGQDIDLILAGDGIDALFGRVGNDYLFADVEFHRDRDRNGDDWLTIHDNLPREHTEGDLIYDLEPDAPRGNTYVQYGTEDVVYNARGIRVLGGADLNVVSWLRANFIRFNQAEDEDEFIKAEGSLGCSSWKIRLDPITVPVIAAPRSAPLMQNPWNPLDVNADGEATPLDALLVINKLNQPAGPAGGEGECSACGSAASFYYDVNGDDNISPLDALIVINHLNGATYIVPAAGAEGEADGLTFGPVFLPPPGQGDRAEDHKPTDDGASLAPVVDRAPIEKAFAGLARQAASESAESDSGDELLDLLAEDVASQWFPFGEGS